jgi:hypothetical protein
VASLTTSQIGALTTAQVRALTSDQIGVFGTDDIRALATSQLVALSSAQIATLSATQAGALSTTQISALTTAQVRSLPAVGIEALSSTQMLALSSAQIRALSSDQIPAIGTADLVALGTAPIAALTTAQVVALSNAQAAALTTAQIVALSTAQVRAMAVDDLASLTTTQIQALQTADFAALTTSQLQALTIDQLGALTTDQTCAVASSQFSALSATQLAALPANYATPLVLDLDGDGVETRSYADGTRFDLDVDGDLDRTGWVSPDDGLLVRDLDGDGLINDGTELFGSATRLPDGSVARDGFEALASLDSNGDGRIDADDPAFAELRVWQDRNSDGLTGADELKTLGDLSINSLGSQPSVQLRADQGNLIGLSSTYDSPDGSRELADVWFLAPGVQTDPASALSDALERYDSGLESSSGGRGQAEASAGALYSDEKVEGIMAALSSFSQSGGVVERIAGTLPTAANPLSTSSSDDPSRRTDPSDPLLLGKS